MEPIKFVHLTDTHMNAPGKDGLLAKYNLSEKVEQVFTWIEETNLNPAFVVITGDVVHEGDTEDYAYVRRLLDEGSRRIGVPVYIVLGNHDHRKPFREGYLGEQPSEEPYYYSHTIDGLRLIGLNSQVEGSNNGTIDEQQVAWLKQELSTPAPKGTIIALHHPMLAIPGMPADHILSNRREIGEIVADTDVIGVVAGHVHSNNVGSYLGVVNVAACGTAFTGEIDNEQYFRMINACSFNVVTVTPGDGITVRTVEIPTDRQEYFRFSAAALAEQHH